MIKFIKKNWTKFIISMSICLMAIFSFAFSCKTYAYTINEQGNLVGENLFNDIRQRAVANVTYTKDNAQITFTVNSANRPFIYFTCRDVLANVTYTISIDNTNYLTFYEVNSHRITNGDSYTFIPDGNQFDLGFEFNSNVAINTTIKVMLVEGSSAKEWEPYGVWYSSANFDTLENQLNTTNGLLELQIDITKYGWLSYIDNLEYYVTGNYVQTFTFNDLKTNNYISNNATLDLYQLSLYQNPNYSYIKFDIYFQNSYANLDYFSANLFDISTKLGFNGVISIYDTDSNSAVFNITDIVSITYEDIIEKNSNFGDYIYNVVFEFASPDASTMIYTNSFYSRGYQTGYSYGSNVSTGYYTPIINDLNGRISNLENDILSLNNTIDTLKDLNAQYQQQLADNVGWSSLFFAFADTPFKVVSNVLGFELFGLNLFATFIGMITVFGVVYLLKKFL